MGPLTPLTPVPSGLPFTGHLLERSDRRPALAELGHDRIRSDLTALGTDRFSTAQPVRCFSHRAGAFAAAETSRMALTIASGRSKGIM